MSRIAMNMPKTMQKNAKVRRRSSAAGFAGAAGPEGEGIEAGDLAAVAAMVGPDRLSWW
ncbi:hypothetical protein [Microvirga sp. 17 mud 1-3]|uniref:hypothetical protein n=1 Tax=Microvirga sp. 17 mud 1-3 TaxID=2082949 RepID=UPI001FE2368E|nr:hypothetical protein [Microvirga sp. 17 mud 1-3]